MTPDLMSHMLCHTRCLEGDMRYSICGIRYPAIHLPHANTSLAPRGYRLYERAWSHAVRIVHIPSRQRAWHSICGIRAGVNHRSPPTARRHGIPSWRKGYSCQRSMARSLTLQNRVITCVRLGARFKNFRYSWKLPKKDPKTFPPVAPAARSCHAIMTTHPYPPLRV